MFNFQFLKTYVTLGKTNSFRRTAQLNSMTQSAVSQQMRTLESRLGYRLIERNGRNVRLTQAGTTFLKYAINILNQMDEALIEINEDTKACRGTVKIATIYSIGLYRLQPLIRMFLKQHPDVNIHLEYYHNNLIYEKVMNGSVDFGFVAYPKRKEGFISKTIAEDPLRLIQSAHRPILSKKTVSVKDLHHARFVALSQTTPTGKELHRQFNKLGIHPDVIHEFENVETLKSAVIVGMGCALVPKNILAEEIHRRDLEVIKVKDRDFVRPLGILYLRSRDITKAKEKFYELVAGG